MTTVLRGDRSGVPPLGGEYGPLDDPRLDRRGSRPTLPAETIMLQAAEIVVKRFALAAGVVVLGVGWCLANDYYWQGQDNPLNVVGDLTVAFPFYVLSIAAALGWPRLVGTSLTLVGLGVFASVASSGRDEQFIYGSARVSLAAGLRDGARCRCGASTSSRRRSAVKAHARVRPASQRG